MEQAQFVNRTRGAARRGRKRMNRIVLLMIVACVACVLLVRNYGVRYVLFPTWALPKPAARAALVQGEVWTLDTAQGPVEAFFFPSGRHAPTVVFAHGNGELIDGQLALASWYQEHGFSVLLPEYRGYGRSRGTPRKDALVRDFLAFCDRLRTHPAVDATRIFYHGRSLGGAVVAAAAAERAPRALVLESTFSSVRQLAHERGIPSFLVEASFDTRAALQGAKFPVLLIHGTQDQIVPFTHAAALAAVLPQHRLIREECGHNDCPWRGTEIVHLLLHSTLE